MFLYWLPFNIYSLSPSPEFVVGRGRVKVRSRLDESVK